MKPAVFIGKFRSVLMVFSILSSCVSAQTAPECSWIANTFAPRAQHVQPNGYDMYVHPDGRVYVIQCWEEGQHDVGIYKDGGKIGYCADLGTSWGRDADPAIGGDKNYLYPAVIIKGEGKVGDPPNGEVWHCIRRYNFDGSKAPWLKPYPGVGDDGSFLVVNRNGERIRGVAVCNGELFVADPSGGGAIKVYNAATGGKSFKRSWAVARVYSVCVDGAGTLWVLQQRSDSAPARLLHQRITGSDAGGSFDFPATVDPQTVKFDATNNRLLVAYDGIDQNIKFYTGLTGTPAQAGSLGIAGGVWEGSGPHIGQCGQQRFSGPVAAGVDSSGSIYVAHNGMGRTVTEGSSDMGYGLKIESYTSEGSRNWIVQGLSWTDAAIMDPASESKVYSRFHRFKMDYSKPAGQEWSAAAITYNKFKYPNDPRIHIKDMTPLPGGIRTINGHRLLYMSDMVYSVLAIFRFNEGTDGEVAIPCGFWCRSALSDVWASQHPTAGEWIWVDGNGDGDFGSGEFSQRAGSPDAPHLAGWYVDSAGTVWQSTNRDGVRSFPLTGFTASGVPMYGYASMTNTAMPAPLVEQKRVIYDAAGDVMYLSGYTAGSGTGGWKDPGFVMARYNGWKKGNRTALWTSRFASGTENPGALDVTGKYFFIGYYNSQKTGFTKVYKISDGSFVAQWSPSFESPGQLDGDVDNAFGLTANMRSSGEYLIFQENDIVNKTLMYRWSPLK